MVESDLALRAARFDGENLQSLCSTAADSFVSVAMLTAGILDLESCSTSGEEEASELEDVIAELELVANSPEEHTTLCLTGEDTDAGQDGLPEDDEDESEPYDENDLGEPLDLGGIEDEDYS